MSESPPRHRRPELRQLAQTILDRLDPAVRMAAARAASGSEGKCQQVWCPVCALAALVTGEQHPLLTVDRRAQRRAAGRRPRDGRRHADAPGPARAARHRRAADGPVRTGRTIRRRPGPAAISTSPSPSRSERRLGTVVAGHRPGARRGRLDVVLAVQVRLHGPAAVRCSVARKSKGWNMFRTPAPSSSPVTTSPSPTASTMPWWSGAGSPTWPRPSTSPAPGSRAGSPAGSTPPPVRCRSTAPTPTPRSAALTTAQRILGQGKLLGMYPEGTRSPDGRLYKGKTGMARLALETGVPVIPVAMIGTDVVNPPGSQDVALRPRRGPVRQAAGLLPVRGPGGQPLHRARRHRRGDVRTDAAVRSGVRRPVRRRRQGEHWRARASPTARRPPGCRRPPRASSVACAPARRRRRPRDAPRVARVQS